MQWLAVPLAIAVAGGWGLQAAVLSVRLGEGELERVIGPVPSPLSVWLCVV